MIQTEPVNLLLEKNNKKFIVTADLAKAFSFKTGEEIEVGISYNSPSENLTCLLYNENMQLIANSPVIFTKLVPGKYYVLYKTNDGTQSILFTPIMVNTKSIEKAVSDDKIREFLLINGFIK
jgi:hypothetical protein